MRSGIIAKKLGMTRVFTDGGDHVPQPSAVGAAALLSRNLLIYGLGGLILPFIGIKAIDIVVAALHLA